MRQLRLGMLVVVPVLALGAFAVALSTHSQSASAHPLGNFTINHFDRVDVSETGIEVFNVLDMAEIPTFQERQTMDANGDGSVDDSESGAYAITKARELAATLHLKLDGKLAQLEEVSHKISFPPGQGGLLLLRLTTTLRAELPNEWRASSKPREASVPRGCWCSATSASSKQVPFRATTRRTSQEG